MSALHSGVRFQDPTLGNASPWIYVWNLWSLTASTGFIGLRLWSRRARFGLDDLLVLIAFVFAVASNATIFSALHQGLGSPHGINSLAKCSSVAKIVVTSICLLFVTDFLSKCSTLLLSRRVITHGASPDKKQRLACDSLLLICVVWLFTALGLLGSDCFTRCTLDSNAVCPAGHRVQGVIAVSIALEVAIFALPCWLFARLQMPLGLKITTLGIFAIRLPLVAFSVAYLVTFHTFIKSVAAGSPNIGSGVYWQLVLLACVVVAPSLQALKSTAELFSTSGAQVALNTGTSRKGSAYQLQDMSPAASALRSHRMSRPAAIPVPLQRSTSNAELRPDEPRHKTSISHEKNFDLGGERVPWASASHPSPAPGKMVILRQTDWDVTIDS